MTLTPAAAGNRLLAGLPRICCQGLLAECTPVYLPTGEILAEPGERIRHIYFPTESFISLTTPTDRGTTLEVGLVGNEGVLGVSLILGVDLSPLHALVQGEGTALRLPAAAFRRGLGQDRALDHIMKRYLYVLMSQIAQTAGTSFPALP